MAPELQTESALAVRIFLRLTLLRKMALVVRDDSAHVIDVVVIVLLGILLRVLLQDLDNLASAALLYKPSSWRVNETRKDLSCPTLSRVQRSVSRALLASFGDR